MLSFETPHVEAEGVILFPDHQNPGLWYYTAAQPRVALGPDGRPMFDLWVYTEALVQDIFTGTNIPDEMGGGFLTLGVNCRRDPLDLAKAKKALAKVLQVEDDTLTLSPIPYATGKVSIIALDGLSFPPETAAKPRFVTAILGGATPALLGDLQSIFSLSLSEDGTAFMAGLFQGGGTPVGVVYELEYEGLSPAVHVTITARMDKVRQHFGGGLTGQVSWFKADVAAGLDDLIQSQAVTIDSTRVLDTDAAKAAEERAIALFKEDLIQQLFRPSTPVPPRPDPGADAVGAIARLAQTGTQAAGGVSGSLGLTLKFEHETAHLTGVYDYNARMPARRTDAPQAFLQTLIAPKDHADHVTQVTLGAGADFFDRLTAVVSLPEDQVFDVLNLRQAVVSLTYGAGDPTVPPEVRPPLICQKGGERLRKLAFLRAGRQSLSLDYDITYEFDDLPGETIDTSRYQTERRQSASRAVMIDPLTDFGYRALTLGLGRVTPDVAGIDVAAAFDSTAGFAAARRFRLTAPFSRPLAQVAPEGLAWPIRTRSRAAGTFTLTETYTFTDGSHWTRPPVAALAPFHSIDPPFAETRRLLIQPSVTSPDVDAIDVEVTYDDPLVGYARRFVLTLTPPFAAQTLEWSVLDPARRLAMVRYTVREGGITSQSEWEPTEDPTFVVGSQAARPVTLTLRLIGGTFASLALDAVLVEIRAPDEDGTPRIDEVFFGPDDPRTAQVMLIKRPGTPLTHDFRTRAFRSDGSEHLSDWQSRTDSLNLVISLITL
jgi:hypothetical protein